MLRLTASGRGLLLGTMRSATEQSSWPGAFAPDPQGQQMVGIL